MKMKIIIDWEDWWDVDDVQSWLQRHWGFCLWSISNNSFVGIVTVDSHKDGESLVERLLDDLEGAGYDSPITRSCFVPNV